MTKFIYCAHIYNKQTDILDKQDSQNVLDIPQFTT